MKQPVPGEASQTAGRDDPAETPATRPAGQPRPGSSIVVKPSRMLSETVLADPRSRRTLRALSGFMPDERMEQLCGIEAMAQVSELNAGFQADRVVAYAMSDTKISGNLFVAEGAAFHSRRAWYGIDFKCMLTPDHSKVASFEFRIGDRIPKREWEKHSLPDEWEPLD
ncbi:MAG: DUF930 domain-containing protein [Microvirga sp.]